MAISNRDRIQRALETLRDGLIPFVERNLKASWGSGCELTVKLKSIYPKLEV